MDKNNIIDFNEHQAPGDIPESVIENTEYYDQLFGKDFIQDDEDGDVPAKAKPDKSVRLRDILLPDGLYRRVIKQYALAAVFVLLSIVLCIVYKEPTYLLGFIIAGVLVFLGISTTLDFAAGNIMEIPVICASVNSIALRKTTRVVFRTNEDFPSYYEFFIPGKKDTSVNPNYAYVIYFDPRKPKELLGYTPI